MGCPGLTLGRLALPSHRNLARPTDIASHRATHRAVMVWRMGTDSAPTWRPHLSG